MAKRRIEITIGGRDFTGPAFTSVDKRLTRFMNRQKRAATTTMAFQKALAYTGGFYALYRGLRASFSELMAFETGMARVSTMLDAEMLPKLGEMGDELKAIAIDTGQASETTTKGLYDILSAGIDAGQAMSVLRASARAAVGGVTDTGTASRAAVVALNSYKLSADQAYRVQDLLFATVRKGVLTYEDLATKLGAVASTAAAAGLPLEELLAAIAAMTKAGVPADKAVTALRSTLSVFLKPAAEAARVARRFGIELNTATLRSLGLIGVLEKLQAAGASAEDIAQIFPNRRALAGITALSNNLTEYGKVLEFISSKSLGQMEEAHERTAGTVQKSWEKTLQVLKFFPAAIYEAVATVPRAARAAYDALTGAEAEQERKAAEEAELGRRQRLARAAGEVARIDASNAAARIAALREYSTAYQAHYGVSNSLAENEIRRLQRQIELTQRLQAAEEERFAAQIAASRRAEAAFHAELAARARQRREAEALDRQVFGRYRSLQAGMQRELATGGMDYAGQVAYDARQGGVHPRLIENLADLARKVDARRKQEETAQRQRERQIAMERSATSLRESLDPRLALRRQLEEILELRQAGAISRGTQLRGYRSAVQGFNAGRYETIDQTIRAQESYGLTRAPGQDREARVLRTQEKQLDTMKDMDQEVRALRQDLVQLFGRGDAVKLIYMPVD